MAEHNVPQQYYQLIIQQLQAEVHLIARLLDHPGLQGEENEAILRNLLRRFLPTKYGVGSGVVIDHTGQQSNQCDIVIYDAAAYPPIFALTSVHLFPVELVYATIEVKTTLTAAKAGEAIENIHSVRTLQPSLQPFPMVTMHGSPDEVTRPELAAIRSLGGGEEVTVTWRTSMPPVGIIFGYKSAVRSTTWKRWFTPKSQTPARPDHFPRMICCLDQGLLLLDTPVDWMDRPQPGGWVPETGLGTLIYEYAPPLNTSGPLATPGEGGTQQPAEIDQSLVLLRFMLKLNEILSQRSLDTTLQYIEEYLYRTEPELAGDDPSTTSLILPDRELKFAIQAWLLQRLPTAQIERFTDAAVDLFMPDSGRYYQFRLALLAASTPRALTELGADVTTTHLFVTPSRISAERLRELARRIPALEESGSYVVGYFAPPEGFHAVYVSPRVPHSPPPAAAGDT